MDTPGYDPVSMTGIVAGGANVLRLHHRPRLGVRLQAGAVDQGRHQHAAVQHMIDDMDINAGVILDGTPVEEVGRQIFEEILAVAGGQEDQERNQRRRRGRVRAVEHWADVVIGGGSRVGLGLPYCKAGR